MAGNTNVMDILKLEILTNDLPGTEQFYHGILGLDVLEKSDFGISFLAGETTLTFRPVANLKPIYHFAFNIPCNKLNEAFDWMAKRTDIMDVTAGNKIADFVNWNAKSFYFYDNNGNILEFIARFELENESNVEFGSDSILNISEIGVCTDDVNAECDELIKKYGLPVFSKQPRLENFTAMGDNNGLLILSISNRHWYPTEKVAQKHYTSIEISDRGQQQIFKFYPEEAAGISIN